MGDVFDDALGDVRIKEWVEETNILLFGLVEQGDESGHQRRHGAGASGSAFHAIDASEIVGRAHGDIGHPAAGLSGVDRDRQIRVGLVRRRRNDGADASATGPTAAARNIFVERRSVVPDDVVPICVNLRAAAGKHHIVHRRMIHMDFSIPAHGVLIGGSVVARRDADGNSHACGGHEEVVKILNPLGIVGILRTSPADRDHARIALRIVDSAADRVDKALVAIIWSEVDGEVGFGRNRAGDFDVQHHFPIGGVRRGRSVARMVHRHGSDVRRGNLNLLEENLEVAGAKTSS